MTTDEYSGERIIQRMCLGIFIEIGQIVRLVVSEWNDTFVDRSSFMIVPRLLVCSIIFPYKLIKGGKNKTSVTFLKH